MTGAVEVYMDIKGETRYIGLLRYLSKRRGQSSSFEYADDWLSYKAAFAIDPANLPLQQGTFFHNLARSALPGALRDTAPDRWGQMLIKRAFRKAGKERTLSEIDYLLAMNDRTRIGALRYKRPGEDTFNHDLGQYRVPPLISLPALINAADAVQSNSETADDLKLLLNEGSPLGGARPKSAVQDKEGSLAIAKFSRPDDDRSIPHGEILAMQLAKQVGLNVAEARILNVKNRPVSLIKRFDRDGDTRIPFISAMTMLGLKDGDEATYTDIAEMIRMYGLNPLTDLYELWRRLVFNILISNLDDHLRNHGFLYAGDDKWCLAPAYDLNPVPIEEKARVLSTWISEEGPDASLDLALNAARYFGLKHTRAKAIIDEISAVTRQWRNMANRIGMSSADQAIYASAFT